MRRGFGLIELMILVAIVGILAAIIIPTIQARHMKACQKWRATDRFLVCTPAGCVREMDIIECLDP